jgi:hypothetical protein
MSRWTTRARALGVVALLTLALVTLASRPAQIRAADDWGIHSNGWVACFNNKSDAFLQYYAIGFNNVASAPQYIEPHSQVCDIKGTASLLGGPANMGPVEFTIRPHGDRIAPIIGRVRVWANSSIFLTPTAELSCSLEGDAADYYYGCAVGFYGMQNPVIFTLVSKTPHPPGRGHRPPRS